MNVRRRVSEAFGRRFPGAPPLLVRAPGRVNLIGEHTDYNEGFVLPMAIDRAVWIALRPRDDGRVRALSIDFEGELDLALDSLARGGAGWGEYVKGVAWALYRRGSSLRGWEGVVGGDVPIGAGLASSAALELAAARAFAEVASLEWQPQVMARLAQQAENEWVGVSCGIMDQMVSAGGVAGHALLIDCRTLETEAVPLPPDTAVVVLDTGTRRGLVASAYNERRAQCEAAARALGAIALRDVDPEALEAAHGRLAPTTWRRARHVVTEIRRTLQAAAAMRRGDASELGSLMTASHASLRDDFEVSSPELDAMVACAARLPGCLGARMTGAGFGGCAVALVRAGRARAFAAEVEAGYQAATGLTAAIYVCEATEGAGRMAG